jgi:hypothetical protein
MGCVFAKEFFGNARPSACIPNCILGEVFGAELSELGTTPETEPRSSLVPFLTILRTQPFNQVRRDKRGRGADIKTVDRHLPTKGDLRVK